MRGGGAASTTDGHFIAFGNTLEALCVKVLGQEARGSSTDRQLDRHTGAGRVDAKAGDYADALAKGHKVHLIASESTGALSRPLVLLLRALGRL